MGEKCKVSIRNIRREANEELKKLLKSKEIGEDQEKSIFWESCSAEIAVFNTKEAKMVAEKGMISLNGEDVVSGWLSADQVAKAISVVQSAKTVNEIQTKLKALKL